MNIARAFWQKMLYPERIIIKMTDSLELSRKIRKKCIELVYRTRSSHIGGALSIVDVLSVLYTSVLKYDPENPSWSSRDRLLYSKGHSCTAIYSALFFTGILKEDPVEKFTKNGSFFTSHVNHNVPGVELSTGSLGHACSIGCGMALAGKRGGNPWKVFVILSDGELDEGSNWESFLFAPHHKLNNLVVIVDYNKIQSFGSVQQVLALEPLSKKFEAFGWNSIEIDGHDHDQIQASLNQIAPDSDKPTVIIAHTVKGKGVSFMENKLEWHYRSPSEEQYHLALAEIDNNYSGDGK